VNSKVFRFILIYRHASHRIGTEADGFEELQYLPPRRQVFDVCEGSVSLIKVAGDRWRSGQGREVISDIQLYVEIKL
jgi:hypothetical protein